MKQNLKNYVAIVAVLFFGVSVFGATLELKELDSNYKRINPSNTKNTLISFNSSIKEAKKSVVNIATNKTVFGRSRLTNDPFFSLLLDESHASPSRKKVQNSLGSGVIISQDGHIVTNNHVIKGADEILVTVPGYDQEFTAKLVGADPASDAALLKIDAINLPFIAFGDSQKVEVGDVVFAIGNPFGVGVSITQGIISALNKSGIGLNEYENFIQTDASINVGNSGGALIDSRGALIGINTAILSSSGGSVGIGFAIPSKMVKKIVTDLDKYGYVNKGFLGVSIMNLPKSQKDIYNGRTGALVTAVVRNSPADMVGLKPNDLITQINERSIINITSLSSAVGFLEPDTKVSITWIRNGKIMTGSTNLTKHAKTP